MSGGRWVWMMTGMAGSCALFSITSSACVQHPPWQHCSARPGHALCTCRREQRVRAPAFCFGACTVSQTPPGTPHSSPPPTALRRCWWRAPISSDMWGSRWSFRAPSCRAQHAGMLLSGAGAVTILQSDSGKGPSTQLHTGCRAAVPPGAAACTPPSPPPQWPACGRAARRRPRWPGARCLEGRRGSGSAARPAARCGRGGGGQHTYGKAGEGAGVAVPD